MSGESITSKSTIPIHRDKMVHQNFNENELITSTTSEDSYTPLSETVTTLASNVYKELERIIKNFGENSVKDLMPVMISTLESLDNALHEREMSKFEIDSLKEQNDQLFQQYEREKSFHKEYQQVEFSSFTKRKTICVFFFSSVIFKSKIISKKSNERMKKNFRVLNQSLKSSKLKLAMHPIMLED